MAFLGQHGWLRLAGVGFVGAIIAWLALDPSGNRRARIDRALQRGEIGENTIQQREKFRALCAELVQSAGLTAAVQVNGSLAAGKINIISTSDSAKALTGCARQNAVYDASLDCVFVDESLVNSALPAGEKEWGPRATLLAFILLHEIGHRQLHARSGAMFDSSARAVAAATGRELEADEYAWKALASFYANDLRREGRWVGTSHREEEPFLEKAMNDHDRMVNDLTVMGWELPEEMMRSETEYSPVYRDAAHPMMAARLGRALAAVEYSSVSDYELRVLLNLVREELQRIQATGEKAVCEITAPREIGAVVAAERELLIASKDGLIFRAGKAQAKAAIGPTGYGALSLAPAQAEQGPAGLEEVFAIWRTSESDIAIAAMNGMVANRRNGHWTTRNLGTALAPKISLYRNRVFRDQMQRFSRSVCLLGGDILEGFTLYGVAALELVARPVKELESEISGRTGITRVEVHPTDVLDDELYCTIFDRSDPDALSPRLHGVAVLSLPKLTLKEIKTLDSTVDTGWLETVIVTKNGPSGPEYFGVGLSHREELGWKIWQMFQGQPAKELGESTFLFAYIRDPLNGSDPDARLGPLNRGYDPKFFQAIRRNGKKLLLSYLADSIYDVDMSTGGSRVFSHPGGSTILAAGEDLVVLLPSIGSAGSNRCYCLFVDQ